MTATYLADKSALVRFRHPEVEPRLRPLLEEGLVATCAVIDMELLHSARNVAEFEAIREERTAFDDVPITPDVMQTAIDEDIGQQFRHYLQLRRSCEPVRIVNMLVVGGLPLNRAIERVSSSSSFVSGMMRKVTSMWTPLRSPNRYGFILGFQRRVVCPK